jgi:hypothetical protein
MSDDGSGTDLPAVDHAVVAGTDLDALGAAFADAGLETEYGGEHSNGVTHNRVLGFADGSYLELISTVEPGAESPWWDDAIHGDAGPCAWALPVSDIEAETERIADLGVPVDGPDHSTRDRPDGVTIEWEMTGVGERLGATLPFLVADRTPREYRTTEADSVAGTGITGIAEVVVCVPELDGAVDRFASFFEADSVERRTHEGFGAELARFEDAPVTLAAPLEGEAGRWLADRLDRFGPMPCACLLGSDDPAATAERVDLGDPEPWVGSEVRWVELDVAGRVGVLG